MLRRRVAHRAMLVLVLFACPSQSMLDCRTAFIANRSGSIVRASSQSHLFSAQVSFHAVDNIIQPVFCWSGLQGMDSERFFGIACAIFLSF
jgi:hypothetical protein